MTENLNIPRNKMPQVSSKDIQKFLKWLKKTHGVSHKKTKISVGQLKTIQKEFNTQKVTEMASSTDQKFLKKMVMVSKDNYILDGNHRILALQSIDRASKIMVWKINLDIKDLIPLAHEFPKSFVKHVNESKSFKDFIYEEKEQTVTPSQLKALEKYLDDVWSQLDIDITFTRHFIDRINDKRNGKPVTLTELKKLFIESFKKHGKDINKSGNRHKDIGGVLSDRKTAVNSPFFLKWHNDKKEFELVATTVVRKRKFKPNNKKEKKYMVEDSFKDFLLNEVLITFNKKAYPKFNNVVIIAGGAASGKGFSLGKLLGIEGKVIDVDALKLLVMNSDKMAATVKKATGVDVKKLNLKNSKDTSTAHMVISGELDIADRFENKIFKGVMQANPKRKPNLIFDSTLKSVAKLAKISNNLQLLGYKKKDIHIVWVMNKFDVALKQNKTRDRGVPSEILLQTHRGASVSMASILNMGDRLGTYMDGDIHVAFNQIGVDSEMGKNKAGKGSFKNKDGGGAYLKKSNYITVKNAGSKQASVKDLNATKGKYSVLSKIKQYIPNSDDFT